MKILITGATGFIGSHVLQEVISRGLEPLVLARASSQRATIDRLGVPIRTADIRDPTQCRAAVRDTEVILHLAGLVRARSKKELHEVNGTGVRHLAEAVAEENPSLKRFLLLSSMAAAGPGTPEKPRRAIDPCEPVTDYGRSKLAGEVALKEALGGIPWTIVRPPAVYGPRDRDVFEMFKMASKGLVPIAGFGKKWLSMVYGPDLAAAVLDLALHPEAEEGTFFVAEERPYTWQDLSRHMAAAFDRRARVIPIPHAGVAVVAALSSLWGVMRRKAPLVGLSKMPEVVARGWVCDESPTRQLLPGMTPTNFPEGARITAKWYREQGWLR